MTATAMTLQDPVVFEAEEGEGVVVLAPLHLA